MKALQPIGYQFLQTYDNNVQVSCEMVRKRSFGDLFLGHTVEPIVLLSFFDWAILNGVTETTETLA